MDHKLCVLFCVAFSFVPFSPAEATNLNTFPCKTKQDIYNHSELYVKSICFVPRGNRYKVAEKYCLSHGMKLYNVDSSASLRGVLNFARSRYASSNTRGFSFIDGKDGDMCQTVNNLAGTFAVSFINCSDSLPAKKASGWFLCEYINPWALGCPMCGSGQNPSPYSQCRCPFPFVRRLQKYACGPACDALGYCCAPPKCPTCSSGVQPYANSQCTCDAPLVQIRRKYACGPACDALGYCCN